MSAVSGVGKGIRIISEWNIWLSIVLVAFFLFGGPTKWLLGLFVTSVGDYLWNVIPMGFQIFNSEGAAAWQGGWTIFYWGWWISWAPFVGMFIARISRGRTIREFMVGVMFVPTTIAFLWLCIFGGNAIYAELHATGGVGTAGVAQLVRDWNLPAALYGTIDLVTDITWLNWIMAALATFLLATWFITSSDSGTLVITTMLSMGSDNHRRSSASSGVWEKGSLRQCFCSRAAEGASDRLHRRGPAGQRYPAHDDLRHHQVPA